MWILLFVLSLTIGIGIRRFLVMGKAKKKYRELIDAARFLKKPSSFLGVVPKSSSLLIVFRETHDIFS